MGHHGFCGKYSGKYNSTTVSSAGINSSKGKATLEIKEVGKGAYLVTTVVDKTTTYNELAYLENNVLRAQAQSGEGIISVYFSGKCLNLQFSNKSPSVWTVVNYKFSRCKH
jgi:hypothetical protein